MMGMLLQEGVWIRDLSRTVGVLGSWLWVFARTGSEVVRKGVSTYFIDCLLTWSLVGFALCYSTCYSHCFSTVYCFLILSADLWCMKKRGESRRWCCYLCYCCCPSVGCEPCTCTVFPGPMHFGNEASNTVMQEEHHFSRNVKYNVETIFLCSILLTLINNRYQNCLFFSIVSHGDTAKVLNFWLQ